MGQIISIDVLPDDVLLEIFDFYVNEDSYEGIKKGIEKWQTLVHVCRRWRSVVFGSPRRLNLQLACTQRTPARDMLHVWPSLPLLVQNNLNYETGLEYVDDIIAVLEHCNRVVKIDLYGVNNSNSEIVLAAMQVL
jgi:hypothetical protein